MADISCLYFGSLPFYKDWINIRLRLCYCCSALCLTLIQSWGTLVVTGKDDNCSGFSNAKFAIMSACRLSCLVTRERVSLLTKTKTPYSVSGLIDTALV